MVLHRKRCKSTCSRLTNEVCWYLADEKFKESRSLSGVLTGTTGALRRAWLGIHVSTYSVRVVCLLSSASPVLISRMSTTS